MSARRWRMQNCPYLAIFMLSIIGALVGCREAPAEHRDIGSGTKAAPAMSVVPASTASTSMRETIPSQDATNATEVEKPRNQVSSGCGSFRFALTPGRIVRSANGPGTMDAVLAVNLRGSSKIAQRISLKIDTDYEGVPELDPDVECGDFDFDGHDDFAVNNAWNASYGGPSYVVYLYRKRYERFVFSRELSTLTEESFGFPRVETSKKRLVVYSKSGCCKYWTSEYAVIGGVPRRMKTVTEEEKPSGACVVTTETRKDGRWIQSESPCTEP